MLSKIQAAIRYAWYLTSGVDTLVVYQGVVIRVIRNGHPLREHIGVYVESETEVTVVFEDPEVIVWPPEKRPNELAPKDRRYLKEVDRWIRSIDVITEGEREIERLIAKAKDHTPPLFTALRSGTHDAGRGFRTKSYAGLSIASAKP